MARRHHRQPKDRSIEAELKFRLGGPGDHARLRSTLRRLGAKLEGSYDEENFRFEGRGKVTRRNTLRLRVLDGGPRGVLTAKGPAQFVAGVKVREETETVVENAHATLDLLQQLGFRVLVVYRKHRAVWKLGSIAVTLDRLDFGHFAEVEGPLEEVPGVARSLGLDPGKAVKDSYSVLARKHAADEKKKKAKAAAAPDSAARTA
ncbi:MAG TPA: class IV adenylate cyclase [Candidatus Dormibacteraeota bacterium]|nr:class IV adenylate cyclase [Candidatus Dormibacteraeota bacterium]